MPVFLVLIFFTVVTSFFMRDIYVPADLGKTVLGQEPNFQDLERKDQDGNPVMWLKLESSPF